MRLVENLFKDKRNIVILLLLGLSSLAVPKQGWNFLVWVLFGAFAAALYDFSIYALFYKKIIFPKSAIVSGLIVAGIINNYAGLFTLLFFCFLAIVSKHVIKINNHHIFNPANFGLFFATLFGVPFTWNIEANIYLIIITGIYLAHTFKKLLHVISFLAFFITLFLFKTENPLMIINWFFIFVMLIEPKTSGAGSARGFIFGALTAIFAFIVFNFFPKYDFFICGLFFANLCMPLFKRRPLRYTTKTWTKTV